MDLAWEMRVTYPGQYLTYEENWLAFVERFNELLPTMPIYSNIYFRLLLGLAAELRAGRLLQLACRHPLCLLR